MPDTINSSDQSSAPIGIIAGGGPLPAVVANAVIKSGRAVFICALKGYGEPSLANFPHDWVTFGSVGRVIKKFKSANCQQIVMIGHVKRSDKSLILPDLGALRNAKALLKIAQGGDNQLLSGIAGFLETKGFSVVGAHEIIPENVIGEGALGKHSHRSESEADITRGFEVLRVLGELDVGQAVVVYHGHVLAVEAAEGTDEMLKRVAKLRAEDGVSQKGGVMVKGPKPNQDMRVDMPLIGPVTIELAAAAGLSGVVVEANGVLSYDRATLKKCADDLGIFVEGRKIVR